MENGLQKITFLLLDFDLFVFPTHVLAASEEDATDTNRSDGGFSGGIMAEEERGRVLSFVVDGEADVRSTLEAACSLSDSSSEYLGKACSGSKIR